MFFSSNEQYLEVELISSKINKAGFDLFVVGGCLRDFIFDISNDGTNNGDIDLATNASMEDLKKIFPDMKVVGVSFEVGLIKGISTGVDYEIARFRTENSFDEKRNNVGVSFEGVTIEQDLMRRDLSVNAMAFNPTTDEIYYYDIPSNSILKSSVEDFNLDNENLYRIEFVGNASERIKEDPLRILRYLRIVLRLSRYATKNSIPFEINENDRIEIIRHLTEIDRLSKERIQKELIGILGELISITDPEVFKVFNEEIKPLFDVVMSYILGNSYVKCVNYDQNNKYHKVKLDIHLLETVSRIRENQLYGHLDKLYPKNIDALLLAAFLHDLGKPDRKTINPTTGYSRFIKHEEDSTVIARQILISLKFPNKLVEEVCELIKFHMVISREIEARNYRIRTAFYNKLAIRLKHTDISSLFLLFYADKNIMQSPAPIQDDIISSDIIYSLKNKLKNVSFVQSSTDKCITYIVASKEIKLVYSHKDIIYDGNLPLLITNVMQRTDYIKDVLFDMTKHIIDNPSMNNHQNVHWNTIQRCKYYLDKINKN